MTQIDEKDMMLKCPECGQVHYHRIAPAIIVAIRKGDKLLMAKHSYHKTHKYALVAGFVEAGESIEEAVHREVSEEAVVFYSACSSSLVEIIGLEPTTYRLRTCRSTR